MPPESDGVPMPTLECAVCGAPAFFRHFGRKPVCKPCAAFFRRTVALKKIFKCKTRGNCSLKLCNRYLACKLCRFRKCIDAGMMVGAVVSSERMSAPQTPLDRLVQARKAVYINRFRETSELCAKLQVDRNASLTMTTLFGIELAIRAEFSVVCDFFKQSGVHDFFGADAESRCPRVATSFLSTWVIYEWMWATVRNFGQYTRRLFFLDETYLDVTDASLSKMYGTDSGLLDPWHIGRHGMLCYGEALETSQKLARARLDDAEIAVLTFLLFFRCVKDLYFDDDRVRLDPLLESVFRNLIEHYKQTYEDYALRLDVIVHLTDEIERVQRLFDEHVIMLRLYGRKTTVVKIEEGLCQEKPLTAE